MSAPAITATNRELPRRLGLFDSTNIVVGTMIGSAIFLVPNIVAQNVQSVSATFLVWIVAGAMSLFGALVYAELGAMMPRTGGPYVYLREAWGPVWGFLCGWTFFLAARSGATATAAVGFAIYAGYFVPMSPARSRALAAGLVVALTAVNYCGVRFGAAVQNIFTVLKFLGLLVLIGFTASGSHAGALQSTVAGSGFSLTQWSAALAACLWAYNGWIAISMVGGEIRNPERNLTRAIILGTCLVTAVYSLANWGYLRTLTFAEIAASDRVAAAAASRSMGGMGAGFVALVILLSTLATANGNTLTGSRVYFAQARDGLWFRRFGDAHPTFATPHVSLVGQGIWTVILTVSGSYAQLMSYALITFWIFYGMTAAGLILLRQRNPDAHRPYRMFGYPVTAILFLFVAAGIVISACITSPGPSVAGIVIVASGVPAYYFWRLRSNAA
ncbi:MAG: hypothetical protein C5B51_29380 [Terriglobia bacterium]|nr:MAG: hypothetical protein C5B51_29380 [Terriglobia bacterium]